MRVSFRAHLASGVLTGISVVFTCISLFTCHWVDAYYGSYVSVSVGVGLFSQSDAHCAWYVSTPGWSTVTLICFCLALFFQILVLLHVLISFCYVRYNEHVLKVDTSLIGLATFFLFIGDVVYLIGAIIYWNQYSGVDFGYSFALGCVALFISACAGGPAGHAYKRIRDHGCDHECEGYYY